MGLGLSGGGVGVAKWLMRHGALVLITDLRDRQALAPSLKELDKLKIPYQVVLGKHRAKDFRNADLIIKNPAVPNDSKYLKIARARGMAINTGIGIFLQNFPGKVVAVTGTKGKTTTTTLLFNIVKASGASAFLGGNLRKSPLDQLDDSDRHTIAVLELSSFQTEILKDLKYSPSLAIWTNLYPDHLDRYQGMAGYLRAKSNIFRFQASEDQLVINADQKELVNLAKNAPGQVLFFSVQHELRAGLFVRGSLIVWRSDKGVEKILGSLDRIKLVGQHNYANVLAAVLGALQLKIPIKTIREVVETFAGVNNRLEVVRRMSGLTFINDTASTIPVSTIAALHALQSPIILIASGSDKKLPLDELAEVILNKVHKLILFDDSMSPRLISALKAKNTKKFAEIWQQPLVKSMRQAVALAKEVAQGSGTILLSPAAASFGLFKNEFERGDQFVKAVRAL